MKKLFLHIKRLFRKFWFLLIIAFAISFVIGFGVLLLMTIISMLFFDNIVDVDAVLKNFTDEELAIIFSEKMDKSVSDDDYLNLLAKYQSYFCPKKIDRNTIWTGSTVTDNAYIFSYELKGCELFSTEKQKNIILSKINKKGVHVKRVVNSSRSLVFRYTCRQTNKTVEIVFGANELRV